MAREGIRFTDFYVAQPVCSSSRVALLTGCYPNRLGIVGATGSGKTTLINLLLRYYDVQKGRITIDGVDIRDLDLADLRGLFSLVLQAVLPNPVLTGGNRVNGA